MTLNELLQQVAVVPGATETPAPPQGAFVVNGGPNVSDNAQGAEDEYERDPATGEVKRDENGQPVKKKTAFQAIGESLHPTAKAFVSDQDAQQARLRQRHAQLARQNLAQRSPAQGGSLFSYNPLVG
jgi:hypothetical protein